MSFNVDIKGLDKLQVFASNLAVNYKQDLTASVVSAFQECEQGIIRDCPVKTGRMKKSITLTSGNSNGPNGTGNNNGSSQGEVIARIDIPVPYTGFVEWGHRTRPSKHPSAKHHSNGYVKGRYFVTPNVNRMLSRLSKRR